MNKQYIEARPTRPLVIIGFCCLLTLAAIAAAQTGHAAENTEKKVTDSQDAIASVKSFIAEQKVDKSNKGWRTSLAKPPVASFDESKTYYWNMNTSQGALKIKLLPAVAPMHVTSTIYLTELGFYDGLSFHRVINGFMAQGGCPLGRGTGGPGYKYDGEFDSSVRHDKPGLLSMANAGPGTDGSQFFITFVPTPHLDGKHSIFGEVVEGADVLKKLEALGSPSGQTKEALGIREATISVE